jgi:hypothetical protein
MNKLFVKIVKTLSFSGYQYHIHESFTCTEHGGHVTESKDDQVSFFSHHAVEQLSVTIS